MFLIRLLLLAVALASLAVAVGLGATLIWWSPWPPSDFVSDRHSWMLVLALAVCGVAFGYGSMRLGRSRDMQMRLARLLPYPLNNDG